VVSWEEFVIKRPENLVYVPVFLVFNNRRIDSLEIDLLHINKNGRSHFTEWDIGKILLKELQNEFIDACANRKYADASCSYYEKTFKMNSNWYQLVVCFCTDKPEVLGVITFYKRG